MLKCKNCGKEFEEGTELCDVCGTELKPTDVSENQQPDVCKAKSKKKVVIIAAISIFVVAVLAAIGIKAVPTLKEDGGLLGLLGQDEPMQNDYVFYVKDENINYANLDAEAITTLQLTQKLFDEIDEASVAASAYYLTENVCLNNDGSKVFYPERLERDEEISDRIKEEYTYGDNFSLFYKYVSGSEENMAMEPVRIDTDVVKYSITSDGSKVIYVKGSNGDMFLSDLTESTKIDSSVKDFFMSPDDSKIVYTTTEGDVYLKYFDSEKEKIDGDVTKINYLSNDFSTIYYLKDDVLYKKVEGNEKVKIAEDVDTVLKVCTDGTLYYTKTESVEKNALDYFDDDMKDGDAKLAKPVEPEYPEYPTEDTVYSWMYDDYYDYLVAEMDALDRYEKELEKYRTDKDNYPALYEKYETALSAYNNKLDRDEFRKKMGNCKINMKSTSLFYYNGSEEKIISEDYDNVMCVADAPAIVFKQYNISGAEKLKMTEIAREHSWIFAAEDDLFAETIQGYVEGKLTEKSDFYIAIGENTEQIEESFAYDTSFEINDTGNTVYFLDNVSDENKTGELYCIEVTDDTINAPELYDSDVSLWGMSGFVDDNKICYFKNIKSGTGRGDMYVNKECLDYDVYVYDTVYNEKNDSMVYLADWDEEIGSGILKCYSFNSETDSNASTELAENVGIYRLSKDNSIIFLSDYSKKHYRGTLHLYKDDTDTKIADDVAAILKTYDEKETENYYNIEVEVSTATTTEAEVDL